MAAKLGFEAIEYILKKVLTKKGIKGIATIPGKAYDMRMKQLVDQMAFKMKALGYDINKVTQKEVQGLLDSAEALAKQKPTPESLIKGKKYTDEGGRTWDFGTKDRPFPGFEPKVVPEVSGIDKALKSDFEKTIKKKDRPSIRLIKNFEKELTDIDLAKEGYNLQEIGILKKARNVMKKEGQNPDDALSWVRSEMADDAGIDFEDFMTDFDWGDFPGKAEGGRIGFGPGGLAKGAKWFINSLKKNLTDMEAGHPRFKVVPAKDQETLKKGYRIFIKELEAGEEIPIEALEAISKNPQYYKTKKVVRSQDPDLAEVEELIDAKVFGNVRQELKDLETVGRKSNASGGRVPLMYGGDPGFQFEYGGSWADWRDQHQHQMPVTDYIKTKMPKERLPFRDMQSGGLAYMLGEPTYGAGGSVGHAPWHKPSGQPQPQGQNETPTPNVATRPDPMKAPRGLPSVAPKNMDPAHMQQQMMQKAMMGRGQGIPGQGPRTMANAGGRIGFGDGTPEDFNQFMKEREQMHREGGKQNILRDWERYKRFKKYGKTAVQEAAEGGIMRMGFKKGGDMSRRGFMKLIAGIAALPVIGKYFKLAKPAAKAVEAAVTFEKTAGMPAWFPALVNRIIKEGDEVTKKLGTVEREMVHTQKIKGGEEVTVYRNLDTGNVRVEYGPPVMDKKGNIIRASNDNEVVHLEYKAGEVIDEGKHAGKKTDPEFSAAESEPEVANWDGDIEWSGVNEANKVEDLITDTSKLEEFATSKPLNITKRLTSERKQKYRNKLEKDQGEQMDYIEKKRGPFPDPGDYSLDADEMAEVIPKWQGKASGGLAGLLGE